MQAPSVASVEELTVFLRSKSIEAAEKELVTVQEYANKNGYAQLEYHAMGASCGPIDVVYGVYVYLDQLIDS